MAYHGINFRATSGFVTDATGETHCLGEAYPVTRASKTFGFSISLAANARDRDNAFDRRLAGGVFRANNAGVFKFFFDAPEGAGTYLLRLALGDPANEQAHFCTIRDGDGGTVLGTVTGSTGVSSYSWRDATGVERVGIPDGLPDPATKWPLTNAPLTVNLASGVLCLDLGNTSGALATFIGHVSLERVATNVITGPTGAAGAASITHAVNELQNNAGTWSSTGGSAWSLTGTDAGLLSISSGGVVTLASGLFDRETKASYSFNVLRDAVAQAVTLNINNVNEAPTFSGPDISVPGLVVGTPMGSINAALLFADPDSGDTGTYSAVGTWPAGITVSSAGLISGTPSAAGTSSSLRVRRTDGGGLTADSNLFSITVSATSTPVSFSGTVGAQSGTVGTAFSWSGSALASFFSGSLTPFTYNVSAGSLPPGLTLNSSTGVVSGTPTTAGTFNATFRALDTGSNAATSNSVAFTIAAAPSAPGFDFHTAAGCIFGAIAGSLVGLAREVGVSITTRVYNATTGALVATLPATTTDSNGRLPRLTDAALVSGTNYRLVFVWPDGSAYTINMVAS